MKDFKTKLMTKMVIKKISQLLLTVSILTAPFALRAQLEQYLYDGEVVVGTSDSRMFLTVNETDDYVEFQVSSLGRINARAYQTTIVYDTTNLVLLDVTLQKDISSFEQGKCPFPAVAMPPAFMAKYPTFEARANEHLPILDGAGLGMKFIYTSIGMYDIDSPFVAMAEGEMIHTYSFYCRKKTSGKPLEATDFGFFCQPPITPMKPLHSTMWIYFGLSVRNSKATSVSWTYVKPNLFLFRSPSYVTAEHVSDISATAATFHATFTRGDLKPANIIRSGYFEATNDAILNWDSIAHYGFIYSDTDADILVKGLTTKINIDGTDYEFPNAAEIAAGAFTRNNKTFFIQQILDNHSSEQTVSFAQTITGLNRETIYYAWPFIQYTFETSYPHLNMGGKLLLRTTDEMLNCNALADATIYEDAPRAGYYTHNGTSWDVTPQEGITLAKAYYNIIINGTLYTGSTLAEFEFPVGITLVKWYGEDTYGNLDSCEFTVTVNEIPTDLLDCDKLSNKLIELDVTGLTYYSHSGTSWDAVTFAGIKLTNLHYRLDGATTGTGTTLNGVDFNLGVTTVTWIALSNLGAEDSCKFEVEVVNIACPENVEFEGGPYDVVKLAGMCWSSNMATRHYDNGAPIAFAKAYNCKTCKDSTELASVFGLLYTWYSAVGVSEGSTEQPALNDNGFVQGICPEGWHVPSQTELDKLNQYAVEVLKSTDYWINAGGTNATGFNALPAGKYSGERNRFEDLYGFTGYWANDSQTNMHAHYFSISYYCNSIDNNITKKSDGLSVRCVMDY
jgi:uncharacterized protein (TIGR02145 family)